MWDGASNDISRSLPLWDPEARTDEPNRCICDSPLEMQIGKNGSWEEVCPNPNHSKDISTKLGRFNTI